MYCHVLIQVNYTNKGYQSHSRSNQRLKYQAPVFLPNTPPVPISTLIYYGKETQSLPSITKFL
jgi:hypothetical protein